PAIAPVMPTLRRPSRSKPTPAVEGRDAAPAMLEESKPVKRPVVPTHAARPGVVGTNPAITRPEIIPTVVPPKSHHASFVSVWNDVDARLAKYSFSATPSPRPRSMLVVIVCGTPRRLPYASSTRNGIATPAGATSGT